MDVSADRPAPAVGAQGGQRGPSEGWRPAGRRRPSGQPPPLPHHVQTTGVGWLAAAVLLVALSVLVFGRGLRGSALAVTAIDDAAARWLSELHAPGLLPVLRAVAALSSWAAINVLLWGLLLAVLIRRRLTHLLVVLVALVFQGAPDRRPAGATDVQVGAVAAPVGDREHLVRGEQATSTLSFTTRGSLDQELDRRSNGRLHLDLGQSP